MIVKYLEYIEKKEKEYQKMFIGKEYDHRKTDKKEMEEFNNNKLGDLEISNDLQKTNKDDLLVSYDFNSLY